MRRTLFLFGTLVLLWAIVSQVNHYLAPLHVYLFVGGLFVTYAGMRMPPRSGFTAVSLAGLLHDAVAPVSFGTHFLLMAAAFVFIQRVRERLPRDETAVALFVALVANLALFMGLSFTQIGNAPAPGAAWMRLFADLFWSQLSIVLIAPWFLSLQTRTMLLAKDRTSVFD